jgi:RNA polymerase sigma-70 factor (ECF subfamily)
LGPHSFRHAQPGSAGSAVGRYQLEAVVQSDHAARRLTGQTDWAAIAQAYDVLWAMSNSPVVAINRAIAIAEMRGAASGLAALNVVAADARLRDYQPYWAARATLLARTGHGDLSEAAYRRAIGLETDGAAILAATPRRTPIRPQHLLPGGGARGAKPTGCDPRRVLRSAVQ